MAAGAEGGSSGARADAGALGPRESIRHLSRCFGQAQPPPISSQQAGLRQDESASLPAADPLALAACPAQHISLEAEIPEALFDGMRAFIQARPDWDQYSLVTSALAGFLFQHGWAGGCVSEHYLNGLFRDEAA